MLSTALPPMPSMRRIVLRPNVILRWYASPRLTLTTQSIQSIQARNDRLPSSFGSRRKLSSRSLLKSKIDPFRTLKIPRDATYAQAKKSFLKIAMRHHPDTISNNSDNDKEEERRKRSIEIFMKCREALEELVECGTTGKCLLRSEVTQQQQQSSQDGKMMSDEEFDEWFQAETGHQSPFQFDINPETMREVAEMHEDMHSSPGLDRDGGMWHLAAMISNTVKSNKGDAAAAASVLKLEAGPGSGAAGAGFGAGEHQVKGQLDKRRRRRRTTGAAFQRNAIKTI